MFQATRRRLAIWYTLVTAVLLLLFASGFYFYVRETLIERIDDTLKHVVEVIERAIQVETDSSFDQTRPQDLRVTNPLALRSEDFKAPDLQARELPALQVINGWDGQVDDDRIDLEWFSPDRQLVWATSAETSDIAVYPQAKATTVHLGSGYGIRQLTRAIQIHHQLIGYLRVSHPWFEVTKPIRQLSIDLTLGLILMVVSTAAIGWFLSGLAMEPVWQSYNRLKQFTADASHELRSPIASIQTNVQVALSDPTLDPPMQHNWHVIERLTRRLGHLVDDLLFLARHDSAITPQDWEVWCPLDEILLEVMEEQQPIAQDKQINLTFDIMSSESDSGDQLAYSLKGNAHQLTRLFTNLVTNALQYTPSGGTVQVLLKSISRQGVPYLQVQVADTGIGIPPEAQHQIFERFYRVDPARAHDSHQGSGLGLSIAQVITTHHDGTLEVDSQLGQGSTFRVTLPAPTGSHPVL